jgi:hypothetical protein
MTVLNSMDEGGNHNIKYVNIILNEWTILILSLVGNFKLPEQATNFSQIQVKMNKLCHQIEDNLTESSKKSIFWKKSFTKYFKL